MNRNKLGSGGVLLAHSLFLRHDTKQQQRMRPYSPLATLLAAATLRTRGSPVHLFDATFAAGVNEFSRMLDDVRPGIVAIVEDNFNFVTKMCTAQMRDDALAMVRAAHERGCLVLVNGSDTIDHPEYYLAVGADAVIVGEVESTLCDVELAWRTGHSFEALGNVPGLALAEPGAAAGERVRVRRTAPRAFLHDLNDLPFPAWDLLDASPYRDAWRQAHGRLSWNVVTSRGCPYGCNWCAKPLWGRRYAQRNPELVAAELALLREQIAPDHIWFADDIFGLTPGWVEAFSTAVHERDARLPFMMQSRANLLQPRTVAALAASGAEEVWLGVESGAQHVLDAMNKGTTVEQVRAATRLLRAHGIRCGWFVMLGYPGEEWQDILLTRDLIREEAPDEIGVSVAYPLPGTAFHERVRAQLGQQRNWRDTDELAMLFQGRYDTGFYRNVRDALHAEVGVPNGELANGAASLDQAWDELGRRAVTAGSRERTPALRRG